MSCASAILPQPGHRYYEYVLTIPGEYKLHTEGNRRVEKWALRRAYEALLPAEIIQRTKQEFSQGTGVTDLLPARIEPLVSDAELAAAQAEFPFVRSREECYYLRLFRERFGEGAIATVGQWPYT